MGVRCAYVLHETEREREGGSVYCFVSLLVCLSVCQSVCLCLLFDCLIFLQLGPKRVLSQLHGHIGRNGPVQPGRWRMLMQP